MALPGRLGSDLWNAVPMLGIGPAPRSLLLRREWQVVVAAGEGAEPACLGLVEGPGEGVDGLVGGVLEEVAVASSPWPASWVDVHLRRTGTVMLCHGRPWPGSTVRLEVTRREWVGLGDGWGQLDGRQVEVRSTGRGAAHHGRTARLWLPDATGSVSAVETDTAADTIPQPGAFAAVA